jgi:hypothetical protein
MKRVFAPVPNYFGGSMKKISAVLLVLVLVGSVAFAGFTGSATSKFIGNLDTGEFGFENGQVVTFDVVLAEALGSSEGSGDVYAEIAASLTLDFAIEDQGQGEGVAAAGLTTDIKFDYARIVGDNWSVSILGALASPNFVKSAIDTWYDAVEEEDNDFDLVPGVGKEGHGIEIEVAGYKLGLGIPYGPTNKIVKDDTKYNVKVTLETPDIELADGLKLAFGAGAHLQDTGQTIAAALKAGYEADDLAVTVATDVGYVVDGDFDVEVGVNAVYDFVTADVYYATKLDPAAAADADMYYGAKNILSVKAAAEIDAFTVELTGKDLVNTTNLGVSVDWDATDELTANVNGGYAVQGTIKGDWYAGAGVTYTVDALEAGLSGSYNNKEELGLSAYVSSKALIDNATLKLEWKSDDLLNEVYGKAIASVEIAF